MFPHLDDFVQRDEGRLERGQLHEQGHRLLVVLLQDLYLLSAAREAGELVGVGPVRVSLEHGQVHAGHVVLAGPEEKKWRTKKPLVFRLLVCGNVQGVGTKFQPEISNF